MRSILCILLLLLVASCSQSQPEDGYKGQEHWVTVSSGVQRSGDYRVFEYDLGSVRRIKNEVIFNYRIDEDMGLMSGLSQDNKRRKQLGLPIILKTTTVVELHCDTRRVKATEIQQIDAAGNKIDQPDTKPILVPPNSPFEKTYDFLCKKGAG